MSQVQSACQHAICVNQWHQAVNWQIKLQRLCNPFGAKLSASYFHFWVRHIWQLHFGSIPCDNCMLHIHGLSLQPAQCKAPHSQLLCGGDTEIWAWLAKMDSVQYHSNVTIAHCTLHRCHIKINTFDSDCYFMTWVHFIPIACIKKSCLPSQGIDCWMDFVRHCLQSSSPHIIIWSAQGFAICITLSFWGQTHVTIACLLSVSHFVWGRPIWQ